MGRLPVRAAGQTGPSAGKASRITARHFATFPIGALLSVSEETALHPLWRAQNAI